MSKRIVKDFRQPADEQEQREREQEPVKKKRRPRRKNWLRVLIRLSLVALLACAVYFFVINWQDIAPDSLVSWIDDMVNGTSGGSWPVSISGDNVSAFEEVGGNVVVLTDTATVYYNSSGAQTVSRTHAFARPMLCVGGKYAAVLELSGSRFRLETRTAVLLEQTVSNKIYTGAVSQQGDVAVVTDSSQSHISEVTVYSRKGVQRYQWLSSELLVMGVSFSSDGNRLAIIGCKAVDGAMQSTLMVANMRDAQAQPVTYTETGTMYTAVYFFSGGTVAAIGDTGTRIVNPTGSLDETYSYDGNELIGYDFGSGGVALALRPYGSQEGGSLTVLTVSGDVRFTDSFEGEFRDLADYQSGFLLLTDSALMSTSSGGFDKQAEAASDSLMTGAVGSKTLVLGLTALQEVPLS